MSDQPTAATPPTAGNFPGAALPTLFADGVWNIAFTSHVARFYLFRAAVALAEGGESRQVIAQIVMPVDSFVQTALFFENALRSLVEGNIVTQELVDDIRRQATEA